MMMMCWIRSEMFLFLLAAFPYGRVLSTEDWHFTGLNVARNKGTTQTPGTYPGGESQLAVDGRRDADWNDRSCSSTPFIYNASASWSVDLNGSYIIKGIRIYNRDILRDNLAFFQIIGYPTEMTLHDDSSVQNKLSQELVINIPVNSTIAFSNITIKIPTRSYNEHYALTLCEVEVYADIKCKAPSSITNGHFIRASNMDYSFGDSLIWTCSDGFKSDQNKTRQCISTSEWSGAEPYCSLITCAFPVNLSNVSLTFSNGSTYESGIVPSKSDIGVHCQKGFRTNVTSITCTSDGEWNTLPTCSQITCNRLGILFNGTYTYTFYNATMANHTEVKFVYGTIAEANCNDAFTYKGELRVCGEDGNWTGVDGTCDNLAFFQIIGYPTEMTLHDDSSVQNKLSQELVINIPVNSTIAFSNITIKIPTRSYNEHYALTLCEVEVYADIKCKAPSSITNGHFIRASNMDYSFGDSLIWTCSDGFKSDQNKTRQCISTSEWSGAEPYCSLITCAFPVNLSNVSLTFSNGSTYESGIVPSKSDIGVHCQKGFRTNVTSITCTSDGEWNTLPTCSQITCNRLGILFNGTYTYTFYNATMANHTEVKFVYGTIAEANCNDAFTYKGELRVCGEDGNWTGVDGTCESETGTGPPMAAVGGIIAGFIGLAAVVAVISLVYTLLH